LYMVCCVFQANNLVNNYLPRKSARTFVSRQEASNKLYTVLCLVLMLDDVHSDNFNFKEYCKKNNITFKKNGRVMIFPTRTHKFRPSSIEKE
jgi:hypothetical protein